MKPQVAKRSIVSLLATAAVTAVWIGTGTGRVGAQPRIPTPESVLGFSVGADFELATYDEAIEYLRRLDAASERLALIDVGRTSEGRAWFLALISSADNLTRIDRYREIALRLAHPQGLTDDEARALARQGKPFVDISGGLHASEVAGAQHTIQLAYDLLTSDDDPEIAAILDHVVLLLWPSLNPDGQNMVVEWYESNLGTAFEAAPLALVPEVHRPRQQS